MSDILAQNSEQPGARNAARSGPLLNARRMALLGGLALAVALFFAFGLQRYFRLEALDEIAVHIRVWVTDNGLVAAVGLVAIYAGAVVLFPPSGTAMTLTAGFIFGGLVGGALAVVGATAGAVLLFSIAKTALGDPIEARFGPRIKKLEKGFQENAFSYLMILRLIPLFPFWLVNIAPAFLGVRLRVYFLATVLGILPGTFVYASVGAGLGRLASADISLAELLKIEFLLPAAGLLVLALLPAVYKCIRSRRLAVRI